MKQAVNKTEAVKPVADKMTSETKSQEPNKAEVSRLIKLTKTNLFNRFLEANCDCV